jgi:hypothetical protein
MRFKYHSYISQLSNCPPFNFKPQERRSFRFVFEDLDHKNNFLPVLLIKPERINSPQFSNDEAKCSGYGLSFFNTLESAQKRYLALKKSFRNINKIIGTHIAEGMITKEDGVVSDISPGGHFDLHEYEQVNLRSKFFLVARVHN